MSILSLVNWNWKSRVAFGLGLVALLAVAVWEAQSQSTSRRSFRRLETSEQVWLQLDANADQQLTKAELNQGLSDWLDQLDPGGSGQISQEIFLQRFGDVVTPPSSRRSRSSFLNRYLVLFLALDQNGDRQLTKRELQDRFSTWFDLWRGEANSVPESAFRIGFDAAMPRTNLTGMAQAGAQVRPPGLPEPPPSPVLAPRDAMDTTKLADGFQLALAASEPLIEDPIAMAFDAQGRLFVVELRSFMVDIEGSDERAPIGRITRLTDHDGDGRFDRADRFLDGLVLPRSVLPIHGGALFVADHQLHFAPDEDNDGRADKIVLVDPEYGRGNIEHAPNGLMRSMDNWIYNARSRYRYRWVGGALIRQETEVRGQWGMTHDNQGRLFYNINNSQLLGDVSPPNYLSRNANYPSDAGLNLYVATDQRVFPIRMNTAVNRGYLPEVLDDRGRLHVFASSCSPVIYRGHQYGADFVGNAFVCDPAANLIKRNRVHYRASTMSATFAYPDREFLASTDERFRPVAMANGPDGNLWFLDMYRGISQYGMFMTDYLKNESLSRGLEQGIHLGRVYRIVPPNPVPAERVLWSGQSPEEWVARLEHPNGWIRDQAQYQIVDRGDRSVLPLLLKQLHQSEHPEGQLHVLWTIEGLCLETTSTNPDNEPMLRPIEVLEAAIQVAPGTDQAFNSVVAKIDAPEASVASTAIRVGEALALGSISRQELLRAALEARVAREAPIEVRFQALLTAGALSMPASFGLMKTILEGNEDIRLLREAAVSGLEGWELSFLQALASDAKWQTATPGRTELVLALSQAIGTERDGTKTELLLETASARLEGQSWITRAILLGLKTGLSARSPNRLRLSQGPPLITVESRPREPRLAKAAESLEPLLAWPGHHWESEPDEESRPSAPLSSEDAAVLQQGEGLYQTICAGCHGLAGEGVRPMAPPLKASEWVVGEPRKLIQIVLQGMRGPVSVNGREYGVPDILPEMPPLASLSDGQIAAVSSYIRHAFDNGAQAITETEVTETRAQTQQRQIPWTAAELTP